MPKRKTNDEDFIDSLAFTGALKGTILEGFRPRTMGAEIVLTEDVFPYGSKLAALRETPSEWEDFVHRTARLPGFRDFQSVEKVREWLTTRACEDGMASLGTDIKETQIQVHHLGKSPCQFVDSLDDDTKEMLLAGKCHSSNELEGLFPRPETCKKEHHTLVLHRSGWRIKHVDPPKVYDFSSFELCLDFESGQEVLSAPQGKKFLAINEKCGVFYEASESPSSSSYFHPFLKSLTLGALKSLIQKLIRFRAPLVDIDGTRFPTSEILNQAMRLAASSPGTFVPHLQQFERGLPSWLKRMVVIAIEDAYVVGGEETLHSMALGAIISTQDPSWHPSDEQMEKWFAFGQAMLSSTTAVEYDCSQAGPPFVLQPGLSALERTSCFVDILKSFPWDLTMIRHVARLAASSVVQDQGSNPPVMPISHFWDHHIAPQLVYLCPKEIIPMAKALCDEATFGDLNGDSPSTPYALFFKALFQQVTGLNPRRRSDVAEHYEKNLFVQKIREAQCMFQRLYFSKPADGVKPEAESLFTYELDPMWAAAAMGHKTVKLQNKKFLVFIRQVLPTIQIGVVREPARAQRDTEMDPIDRDLVLQQGLRLFQRAECQLFGRRITWHDLGQPLTLEQRASLGVAQYKCNLSLREFQRLEFLSSGYVKVIELPRITRNGGSDARTENPLTVNILDIAISEFLRQFSCQFPEVMVLQSDARQFQIKKQAVWWTMMQTWRKSYVHVSPTADSKWDFHSDEQQRVLHPDQENALSHFQERWTMGEKANMLIMPTGAGKTLVMMSYLHWLSERKALPPYILYVVPFSAMDSVIREIQAFTSEVQRYDSRKNGKRELKPFVIQVLDMNHGARLADGQFDEVMANALLIVDELHECLAATQRTACVQKLVSSAQMTIACTATPTIDNNIYRLLPFLRPLVKFPIDANSFFIGWSAVDEQTQPTGIQIQEAEAYVEVDNSEYQALLPTRLGGLNGGRLEMHELNQLFKWALYAATDKAIQIIWEAIKKERIVFQWDPAKKAIEVVLEAVKKERVFVAAVNQCHALVIEQKLHDIDPTLRIKMMTRQEEVETLTDQNSPIDVVIVTMQVRTGYSVTICKTLVLFVWPSNPATRTQIRGRINRRSTPFKTLRYVTVYAGALQRLTFQKQDKCDSFTAILRDIYHK